MDPDLIKQLLSRLKPATGQVSSSRPNLSGVPSDGLTDAQIRVIQQLAQHHANRASAPAAKRPNTFRKFWEEEFGEMNPTADQRETVDPNAPVVIKVEYIGAVRQHRQRGNGGRTTCIHCRRTWSFGLVGMLSPRLCPACGGSIIQTSVEESYASAWVDGGWNVRFPEQVLRDFFPEPPPKFDGNFHKALLHGDINKTFKQLARQWHPDLNRTKGAHAMFLKLRAAYDDLRDPVRRKRYEAGLKFQTQALQKEVVFRVPKSCGLVEVVGERGDAFKDTLRHELRLTVTKILSWTDIFNEQGQVMSSRWNSPKAFSADGRPLWQREGQPFTVEWLDNTDLEFDIDL